MILRKEVIESISKKLELPFSGTEQDWAIEMANAKRLNEFISYYKDVFLTKNERVALMSLILASFDDLLNEQKGTKADYWERIKTEIQREKKIFTDLITYWKVEEETLSENHFELTFLMREMNDS